MKTTVTTSKWFILNMKNVIRLLFMMTRKIILLTNILRGFHLRKRNFNFLTDHDDIYTFRFVK